MPASREILNSAVYRYATARIRVEGQRPDSDTAVLQALLSDDGLAAYAQELLGVLASRSGTPERALEHFRKAIALNARVPSFHLNQGNALHDLGRIDRAISSYRRALRLWPAYQEAQNDLGTAYDQKGWHDESIECYRRAIAISPHHGVAHGNLASAYRKLRRFRDARHHYFEELKCRVRSAFIGTGSRLARALRSLDAGGPSAADIAGLAERCKDAGDPDMAERLCGVALKMDARQGQALLLILALLARRGAVAAGLEIAGAASAAFGNDADFLLALANLHRKGRDRDAAEAAFRRALAVRRKFPQAMLGLGRILLDKGRMAEAAASLRGAVRIAPGYAKGWVHLGLAEAQLGNRLEAEKCLARALEIAPDDATALDALGGLYRDRNALAESERCYKRIIELDRDNVAARLQLGAVLQEHSRFADAIDCWKEVIAIDPSDWRAYNHIAVQYNIVGMRAEALRYFQQGLAQKPDATAIFLNMVLLHIDDDDLASARSALEQAQRIAPEDAKVMNMCGALDVLQGDLEHAEAAFKRAIEAAGENATSNLAARARLSLAHVLLEKCDLAAAWPLYEYRRHVSEYDRIHAQVLLPAWEGEAPRQQSLLIYPEQGIGDEMMFASCLPDLLRDGNQCTLLCSPKLAVLFQRSFPSARVHATEVADIPAKIASLAAKPRHKIAIGSLPSFYRKSLDAFALHEGYFKADPAKIASWRERLNTLGHGPKIGLSWKGGLRWTSELRRTMSLDALLPLLGIPGATFVSLQYSDCREELAKFKSERGIELPHWQEAMDDYDETAALVASLDLVVTVCTALVHLAGGLGKRVLVMAPQRPTWRYAMTPGGMPWYPSVRVIRQHAHGDWDAVVSSVVSEVREMTGSRD